MKSSHLASLLLLIPSVAMSQTLCQKDEIDYFSCRVTRGEKIISVCSNITNGEITDDSWLQYRFGKMGAIELTYPKKRQDSVLKFEGNYFNKYSVIDLRFINGNTLYGVDLNGPYSGDDATKRKTYSGGVSAESGKNGRVTIQCAKVDGQKYFDIFSGINNSIRNHNGETDFLYRFHNRVAK